MTPVTPHTTDSAKPSISAYRTMKIIPQMRSGSNEAAR